MKNKIIFFTFIWITGLLLNNTFAQTTGLFTYEGGYFIKNGSSWSEYRPTDKDGVWATYTQSNEETHYFQIKNEHCTLSIPKESRNSFYIYKDNAWNIIYRTREIYNYFTDKSRKIYCYQGGYFVRDGNAWREYRPAEKNGLWASYTQYNEDDNYYMIKNSLCNVSVPKKTVNDFYLLENNSWTKCYVSTDIYDVTAGYDYNFLFGHYKIADQDGKMKDVQSSARISFNRKGEGEICYGSNTRSFRFSQLCIVTLRDSDVEMGFKILFDNDEYLAFLDSWCMVNVKSICPFMDFMDCTNTSEIESVKDLIRRKTFFK